MRTYKHKRRVRVERQEGTLARLELQLESGFKNTKIGQPKLSLSKSNIKRIGKEIKKLESRI